MIHTLKRMRAHGVHSTSACIVMFELANRPAGSCELARRCGLDQPNVTTLMNRLAKIHLVEKRGVNQQWHLTKRGEGVIQ